MFFRYSVKNVVDPYREAEEDIETFSRRMLARPAQGAAGPTGTWRTLKPVIHAESCVKCGMCWLYCPDNVIEWRPGEVPRIDYEYCKGCGVCSTVCPRKAIEMVVEGE